MYSHPVKSKRNDRGAPGHWGSEGPVLSLPSEVTSLSYVMDHCGPPQDDLIPWDF